MRAAALARHLAVFDQSAPRIVVEDNKLPVVVIEHNDNARLEAARAEGYAQARAEAGAELAAREEQLRVECDMRVEKLRAEWRAEMIDGLGAQLRDGFTAIEQEVALAVAEALEPLVAAAKKESIVAAFRSCLHEILADGAVASIRLDASADVVEELAVQSLFDGRFVDIRAGDADECRARVDRTMVRARLRPWLKDVEEGAGRGRA